MNINEYKEAMEEISVSSIEVEAALQKKMNKDNEIKTKRTIPVYTIMAILLIAFVFANDILVNKPEISITVYAAETGEIPLTNEFANFKVNATPISASSTIDKQGNYQDSTVNYNIWFKCEGQDIKAITYNCSDRDITRGNRSKASAYYVENITMPVEEYKHYDWKKDDTIISGWYGIGETEAQVTKMIGSSYTVSYDQQMNKQYGLVIAATVDEEGNYTVEDTTIKVTIEMQDGSIQKKQLLVHPGKNALLEVDIRIL